MTKLLLDTDIGSDIDDAVCLAYLLAQPDCDLLGVTTVTGQGRERAMLASALCQAAAREVPILVGAESPLLVSQLQPEAPQAAALGSWPHATEFASEPAVEFLRRTIRRHPGEVVLLTIGPLTNVALLFAVDPEIPALLKGLVTMGGSFWAGVFEGHEWNLLLDPHAAAMVLRSRPPYHRLVGLDVTTQVTMDAAEARRRFRAGPLRPVGDFAEVWFAQREQITFHDPLAAAVVFDDGICEFEPGLAEIELTHADELAKTRWMPGEGPHQVATAVDPSRFLTHYFSVAG